MRALEPLGPQQSVGEVKQQPRGHEAGERIIEDHGSPLEPIAGDGVANRQREEAKSSCQQDDIEHAVLPFKMFSGASLQIGVDL